MHSFFKFVKWLIIIVLVIAFVFCGIIYSQGKKMYLVAMSKHSLNEYVEQIRNNSNYLTLDKIPNDYCNAVIAVEDHRFPYHGGFDILGTFRAIINNVVTFSAREGGSTITQQLAKEMCFTQEKDLSRKVAEVLVAFDLEKTYSKDEILELYINKIYYGDGYYGIKKASLGYYGKLPSELTFNELTILAGIPNAPSIYSLTVNPALAKQRQKQVLSAMLEYGYIDKDTMNKTIGL